MRNEKIEAIYPLSPLQQGILFLASYEDRPGIYIEGRSIRIHGSLDVAMLKDAWRTVTERHAALRTLVVWQDLDVAMQVVHKHVELPWQELDWREQPVAEHNERLRTLLKTDQEKGFHLSSAPLFRLILIRLGEDDYQLIWSYHHIVMDGWSVTRVLEEVFTLYTESLRGTSLELEKPIPYKAYIDWLAQQDLASAETFWKDQLQGFSTPTSISSEESLTVAGSGYGYQQFHLRREISTSLRSLARANKLTVNTLFQGAWALLLSRYSGETDVLFGAAVSGRSLPLAGIESMVGLFIGSLPVRVQVRPQEKLTLWLENLQKQQIAALQFEYTSPRDIQAWSDLKRSSGQSLFDSIVSFNNYDFESMLREKAGSLEIRDVNFREGSHYPLTMLIDPLDEIRIRVKYDRSRFDEAAIARLLAHLQILLQDFVTDPNRSLSEYSLLTSEEKQKLLMDFNNTAAPLPDRSVVQLFEEQVALVLDAVALRFKSQTISYAELNKRANQLARHLQKHGVGREQVVALCLDRSPEAVISIIATLKAGGAYLPLDATLPAKRLELMIRETEAPVVLTNQQLAQRLPASNSKIIRLDVDWELIESESGGDLPHDISLDDLAYIIYTSGSTGLPKGALLRHGNLLSYATWARDYYLRGEKLDFPLFSSLSFDLTVTSIFVPLISGGTIVIYGEGSTANMEVLDVVNDDLVDIIKLTPAHLSLLQTAGLKSKRIRRMIVGGEDFKQSLAQRITDQFDGRIEIYNEYGPTEATVGCMIHRYDSGTDTGASVPIGKPVNNAQVYILDKNLQPVPPGVIGEMCIGGAGVARGYLNRPKLTESKFVNDPFNPGAKLYRTGDLARWSADGQMQFLGRMDHQVKIKGYRIELGEIESTLTSHSDVEEAVVIAFQPEIVSGDHVNQRCVRCGLPDNYPGATFDSEGVCKTCREYSILQERFRPYFKTPSDLQKIVDHAKEMRSGKYDCMVLYSGGKDSTYMLYQLVNVYGLQPLVFNLDNGYISEETKTNIRRVTDALGVDLVFGQTPHMNAVFVDSLKRHSNVCDGCFKVIYTLSINMARKQGIRYIFTGLSRGQLFETRLSDMFQAQIFDVEEIDQTVLAARKAYHRKDDAVRQLMDVKIFENDSLFNEVQLVDFYRYTDVPLHEMYEDLKRQRLWVRPSDTGRSTNCLINDAGIYIHKKERGYHNYALPYSWDVRVGHKTTDETVHELNDEIDESKVRKILNEIGYDENEKLSQRTEKRLVAYYVAKQPLPTSEIHQHLSTRLPDYMVPVDFIQLDEMPLTVNGKIDRAALPHPDLSRPKPESAYVAPTTEFENQLVTIWSQVLRLPEIGVNDNFFELGGDSIISIQIVTKAKQTGLRFTPRDIFEKQTIAQLALVVETDQKTSAEQGLVTGDVPLTPIQHWFFEQEFSQPQHWNQSIWLNVPANVDRVALQSALQYLPKQHDMLRARYRKSKDGKWQQSIPADGVALALEFHDLSALAADAQDETLGLKAQILESTLDLETGPLLKAALFAMGPGLPLRLFVTCHHLVIDGVSWQPLLEDWETTYRQLSQGQQIRLPAKTTSFKDWSEKLAAYARSRVLEKEIEFWSSNISEKLPAQDRKVSSSVERISCEFSEADTSSLLQDVHAAYNTTVVDLLIAAWSQSYSDVLGNDVVSVALEGHGRETEPFKDVDLSHTVGWFTTHYPLSVQMANKWDLGDLLKKVKEQIRRVPNHGIGYGVLRYLRADKPLASHPEPDVLFNYMGQFERALPASELFTLAQSLQAGYGPLNHRTHPLELNVFVRAGQLRVNLDFSGDRFVAETVQKLLDTFIRRLRSLIEHCLSPDSGGQTASDFGLAGLSDEQFDNLSSLLNNLDGD